MKFDVDKQTLNDLGIFDTYKNSKSLFNLFNSTRCLGGKSRLYEILRNPLADADKINERKEAIAFFQTHNLSSLLNFDKNSLDFAEYYLRHRYSSRRLPSKLLAIEKKIVSKISQNNEYYLIEKGVCSTVDLIKSIYNFSKALLDKFEENDCPKLLLKNSNEVLKLFAQSEYLEITELKKIKAFDIERFDYLFRYTDRQSIHFFLDLIYEYDVFLTVAETAKKYQFSYPEIAPNSENCLEIDGLYHPFLDGAIENDIRFGESSNLLFISGPNMAGKSTLLKALGISVYLAQVGFPVPAKKMKFSIFSGLSTTINIADDLSSGYSHFYAEVMRIKDVAHKLQDNKKMLVIFDELFRGTNVKDAYDGTLAIVSALAKVTNSFFIISTHIVEVAKELEGVNNIKFAYFEVQEKDGHPFYTYKLKGGVSDVRLGMYIIKREKVIELINNIGLHPKLV